MQRQILIESSVASVDASQIDFWGARSVSVGNLPIGAIY